MSRLKRYGMVECLYILIISMLILIARVIESFELITICVFALFILKSVQTVTKELHVLCDILVERIRGA